MTRPQNILAGINRILSCPKLQASTAAVLSGYFAIRHASAGMSDNAKVELWTGFMAAATVLYREVINAWTEQDVAAINNPPDDPMGRFLDRQAELSSAPRSTLASYSPVDPTPPLNPPGTPASAQRAPSAPVNPNVMSSAPRLTPRTVLPPQQ